MPIKTALVLLVTFVPPLFTTLRAVEMAPIGIGLAILVALWEIGHQIYEVCQGLLAAINAPRN